MSRDKLSEITNGVRERVGEDSGIGATLKIDFEGKGTIFIDGRNAPNNVTNADEPADCTITVSLEDFVRMASGELDAQTAFMQGKMRVIGDMSVAMRAGPVFSG